MNNTIKYNGWTNYETWLCNLWFDNFDFTEDLEMFEHCKERYDVMEVISVYIQDFIEEFVSCSFSEGDAHGFINDMLNSAIREIDYADIAEHYVDDVMDELKLVADDAKSELMGV
jgi:hypothetical protein